MTSSLPVDPLRGLEVMDVIRRTEEHLVRLGRQGLIAGLYPVSIGHEAVAVAVTQLLQTDDVLFSTHRNHAHLLARGVDPQALVAEILGRAGGTNGGRAGSYHPADPALGIPHTSAIVGSSLPLSAGVALAKRRLQQSSIAVAFVGDGVFEQGVAYESLHAAAVLRLPLLIVCEDNSAGAGGPPSAVTIARAFGIQAENVDGADYATLVSLGAGAVEWVRSGQGPVLIQARIHKWPGDLGLHLVEFAHDTDIRVAWDEGLLDEELRTWSSVEDPLLLTARWVLREGLSSQADLVSLDEWVRARVAEAVRLALLSPQPDPRSAMDHVFA